MVTKALSYAVNLSGDLDPSVPRAFGLLDRRVKAVQNELQETTMHQSELNKRLRGVQKGTQEYDQLQREIRHTERRIENLNRELADQARQWQKVQRVSRAANRTALVGTTTLAAGIGTTILAIDKLGESANEILAIANNSSIAVEEVQKLRFAANAVGRDIDFGDINEFGIRLGEQSDNVVDGLKEIGIAASKISQEDLPMVLRALSEVEDSERQAFLADEIFGGTAGEVFKAILQLGPEATAIIDNFNGMTREQLESIQQVNLEMKAFRSEVAVAGASVLQNFIPHMRTALEILTPYVQTFANFVEQNPQVISAIVATGTAITALAAITSATLAIKAIWAALTPGVGWTALAAAGVIGGGVFLAASALTRNVNRANEEAQASAAAEQLTGAVNKGIEPLVDKVNEEDVDRDRQLDNILRVVDCLAERSDDEATEPMLIPISEVPLSDDFIGPRLNAVDALERQQMLNRERETDRLQTVMDRLELTDDDFRTPTSELSPFEQRDRADLLEWRARLLEARGEIPPADYIGFQGRRPLPGEEGFVGPTLVPGIEPDRSIRPEDLLAYTQAVTATPRPLVSPELRQTYEVNPPEIVYQQPGPEVISERVIQQPEFRTEPEIINERGIQPLNNQTTNNQTSSDYHSVTNHVTNRVENVNLYNADREDIEEFFDDFTRIGGR